MLTLNFDLSKLKSENFNSLKKFSLVVSQVELVYNELLRLIQKCKCSRCPNNEEKAVLEGAHRKLKFHC